MSDSKNKISVYTTSNDKELCISFANTKQVVTATNNRAQYYAEQAKKFKDEAKLYRDNAKYYSEQNSDVTFEYIDSVKTSLEFKMSGYQPLGNYALKEELPQNNSELNNDSEFITKTELENVRLSLELPSKIDNNGKFLTTDGENLAWENIYTKSLFDLKISDYILSGDASRGWALQGTYVYKEAMAGSHYGYPDFYNKCLEEKNSATTRELTLDDSTIIIYENSNGHRYYNIEDKETIDNYFTKYGYAWFYGIDTDNERIFLPRNNYFEQITIDISEVGQGIEAGLPNITGNSGTLRGADDSGAQDYSGAMYRQGYSQNAYSTVGTKCSAIFFDASRSNDIYGKSETVQPNAVKKLLYICVGNTFNSAGISDVINQGLDIIDQVNQSIETRVNIDATNLSSEGKQLITAYSMPDYESMIEASGRGTWIQVTKDSFVVSWGNDSYQEDYYAYVSPDKVTTYIVGRRYDDTNGQTEANSITFFVPKNWYFKNSPENQGVHKIYPLKGAI